MNILVDLEVVAEGDTVELSMGPNTGHRWF
jgi:hypothetical protein